MHSAEPRRATRDVSKLATKANFDYEGQSRIEKREGELTAEYGAYLKAHPEIEPMMHDIMQHILILQPERPLQEIRSYVRARARPE